MSQASDYTENKLIDHIFRNRAWTPPTALYVSLHTSNPLDTGAGTEVTGGSYARQNLAPSDSNWKATQGGAPAAASSGTGGQTSNAATITFSPAPTANWGVVTHYGIWDAVSGGNLLVYGALTTSKTINNGDPAPSFAIDALTVTIA